MINKVDGNNYNVYTKSKKVDIPDTDEKFSLGYQKNESSSNAKDKSEVSEQEKQQALERSGVRLELSVGGQAAEADKRKQAAETAKTQSTSQQTSLLETIRMYIMAAITAVREFFYHIWNDQPRESISEDTQLMESAPQGVQSEENALQDDQVVEDVLQNGQTVGGGSQNISSEIPLESEEIIDVSDEISVLALEEERRNREIQQSLRDGNMDHVISLLTDNGRKTIAKNSTLLTSYDKNGRVVEPNASDRERALHGDRNSWKL